MRPVISGNSKGSGATWWSAEQAAAEQRFAQEGMDADWQEARESGDWILYASSAALSRLIQQRPGEFLDGRVFRASYQTLHGQPRPRAYGQPPDRIPKRCRPVG